MPPEIPAGMLALGTAPGTAIAGTGTGPPGSNLSAILFAAFLTQSGTPKPTPLPAPNLPQEPRPALAQLPVMLNVQTPTLSVQTPALKKLVPRTLLIGAVRIRAKTMDSLPQLPLSVTEKPKASADELPLPKATVDTLNTALPGLLPLAPVSPSPQLSLPAAPAPVLNWPQPPASAVPTTGPSAISTPALEAAASASPSQALVQPPPLQAPPLQAPSAQMPPHLVPRHGGPVVADIFTEHGGTPPQVSLVLPQSRRSAPSAVLPIFEAPKGQMPTASAETAAPVASAPSLPSVLPPISSTMAPSVPAPSVPAPSVPAPSVPAPSVPAPSVPVEVTALSFPHAATAKQVVSPSQTVSYEPISGFILPTEATRVSEPALAAIALSVLASETSKPVAAKPVNRSAQITLKPATETADINTSTRPVRIPLGTPFAASERTANPTAARETAVLDAEKPAAKEAPAPFKMPDQSLTLGLTTLGLPTPAAATQTATEMKPLTAPERAAIARQAADGIAANLFGSVPLPVPGAAQQMSVQLHPKDWGSLQVSVSITPGLEAGAAKTVTAHIVAETPQVKAALQSATGALHQALKVSGLHLEHLTVSVKPAEIKIADIKIAEVKPAAQSAAAGMSSGQGQPSQSPSNTYGQPAANSQMNSHGGAGSSQNGRQGQPQSASAPLAEPEESLSAVPLRTGLSRIDMHA